MIISCMEALYEYNIKLQVLCEGMDVCSDGWTEGDYSAKIQPQMYPCKNVYSHTISL